MRRFTFLLSSLLLLALAACSRRDQAVSGPVAVQAAPAAHDDAALVAILAKADAADGSVDMTVSKCAGCKLAMEGHPQHAVTAHGYTLQFCSSECKQRSEPTIDTVVAALK